MGFLGQISKPVLAALLMSGCSQDSASYIEPSHLTPDSAEVVLGFDLRAEHQPTATLVVTQTGGDQGSIVWLPFPGEGVGLEGTLLGGVGHYADYTLITLASSMQTSGSLAASFKPRFWPSPKGAFDIRRLPGNVYLLKEEGLGTTFLYRLNTIRQREAWEAKHSLGDRVRDVETIAVAVPSGSEWREVAPGRTSIPEMTKQAGDLRFFSAQASEDFLEVKYVAPPTSKAGDYAMDAARFLGSLVVPFLTFWLLPGEATKRPQLRRWAMRGLIIAQAGAIFFLLWLGFSSGIASLLEVGRYLIPLLSGATGQALVMAAKKERKADEFTRVV